MTERTLTARPVQAHPLPERFQALYGQISQGFDPLHRETFLDVKVTPARDGYVLLTVALPEGLTRGFVTFLDAMHGLMRCADQQAVKAKRAAAPLDLDKLEEAQQRTDAFKAEVCTRFDQLTNQGVTKAEAIKKVNTQFKAEGHPWAGHEVIRSILSKAGRLRKQAFPSQPKKAAAGTSGARWGGTGRRPGDPSPAR